MKQDKTKRDSNQDNEPDGDVYNKDKTIDNNIGITLMPGEIDSADNFVDVAFGRITGDVQNSEEDCIVEVMIYLKDKDDNVVLTTATDMNGSYSFKDLPPGDYTVSHDIPEGFITTEEGDDDPDGDEFDNDEVVDNNIGVRVYPGQTDSGNNFVDLELGAITGSVKDSAGNVV